MIPITVSFFLNQKGGLFQAAIDATEEAIYNSLFKAETTSGCGHIVEALPLEPTLQILRRMSLLKAKP